MVIRPYFQAKITLEDLDDFFFPNWMNEDDHEVRAVAGNFISRELTSLNLHRFCVIKLKFKESYEGSSCPSHLGFLCIGVGLGRTYNLGHKGWKFHFIRILPLPTPVQC